MRNLLKFIAIALLLSPWMPAAAATPVTTRVGSGSVCPGSDIIVPVTVQHCENVGSISLVLSFDNTKVSYMGCQNFNDKFSSMILNQVDGKVYFAWAETNSVTLDDNDTIVNLRFNGIGGSTSLAWQTAQCEYTDTIGNVIPSNYVNGSINVYQSPTINSGPSDRTVVEGQNTTFEVSASGLGLSYQWRVLTMGATEWVNLSNGGHYSNVNSWRLNVNNVNLDMSGNHYCCVVSGTCEPPLESDMAQLLVTPTPHATINTKAQSTSSCPNTNFAIPIIVTNCNDVGAISLALQFDINKMSYQGYQNPNSALGIEFEVNALNSVVYFTWSSSTAINIGNATLIELLFSSESGNSSFQWVTDDCEYSDVAGNIISTSFTNGSVTVYYSPSVTSHPSDRLVDQGANTNFSIGASGQGLSYQWQVSTDGGYNWSNLSNGGHYSNVNSYNLNVNNVQYDMTGYRYRCVVSGTCSPSVVSNSAVLSVRPTTIHTSVASVSACPDTEFGVAVSATNFNNVGAISLALNYNPNILTYTGYANVNSVLGTGDLVVNATGGTVYVSWSSANGATIGNNEPLFSFLFIGVTGSSSLQWNTSFCEYTTVIGDNIPMTFSNGNANIYQVAMVTGNPEDRSIYETQNTTFGASGSGQGLSYQWQVSTNGGSSWANLANGEHYGYVTSSTLRVNNVTMGMNGYRYRCRITGTCGDPVYTESAELTVIVSQPVVIAENATWQCTGEVSQDIMVEYFNNVGAFSLVLTYDTNYLRYLEHFDLNSAMSSGDFVINYTMGKIYMTYSSANPLNLGSAKMLSLKFDSSGGNSTNSWQTNLCEVTDATGEAFNTGYVNGYINVFSSCSAFTDIDIDYFWYDEIMDLCSRGVVSGYQCQVMPEDTLKRAQLAKMLFISLFGNPHAAVVTDGFPSPFLDMQKTNTYYYKYAKALSYLEYRDGISVFDRDKMNFNPEGTIKREYFIKALLEAFNIPPLYQDTVIFADVPLERSTRGYINRAYKMGILVDVNPDTNPKYFHPKRGIKRGDAMGYLDWLISLYPIPHPNNSQDITQSDFFIPGNYTPYNFTAILGQEMGNFNHTTKSSFNIPARGFPLQFEHTYNSFLTELPQQIFATDPLGQGWSHNYNAYIINTDEVLDDYGHPLVEPCLIIFWPDGTIHVYDNENAPIHPKPITKGVYNVMTHTYSDQYTVKMKDQSVYTFTKIAGTANDAPYMMTRMEDRHGNATVLTYGIGQNGLPRLSTVSDDAGRDLVFTYHPNSNYLKKVTDPLSRSVNFVVEDDNLTAYINAKGDSTFYYYDTLTHYNHLLDSIKLPKGNVITNTYEQRKLTSTKYNNGSPTTIQHNANYVANANVYYSSTVTEMVDGHAVASNHQYDKKGNETHVSIGNSVDVTKTFDDNDPTLLKTMTNNKTGVTVNYEYDSVANITKMTKQGGDITVVNQYEYNAQNDVIKQTDARGNETHFTYQNGKLTKIMDALNHESHISYNNYGQPITIVDALGNQANFDYDTYGNKSSVSIPSMNVSASMVYDMASRMTQTTDFNGNTKNYSYDVLDALLNETDALGHETRYVYDKNGNLTAIRNAAGDSTLFVYDFDSDMLLSMSFQGIMKHYAYNEDGTLHTFTTPNGDVFTMSYDNDGRVTDDGYATYTYNAAGNLQSVTRNGKSLTLGYDVFNRMTSQSYDGQTVSYGYDCNDNVTQVTYPGNHAVLYDYNALNQLVTVTDWNGNVTTYNYRADGSLSSSLYPNQVLNEFMYDGAGRITDMGSKRGNGQGTNIVHYHFELDDNGNQLSSLALEQFVDMPIVNWPDVSYTYNAANRLLSDGINEYLYDYNGNMTAKGGVTYNYDVKNNLVSYGHNGNYAYTYDGQGNRRSASRNGELTKFVLDFDGKVLAELDGSNAVQCYYVYGQGLISRIKPDNSTNYYIYDYRGSVVAMTDDTEEANVTHKYQYDAFGNILQMEEADFNPYRFVGRFGVTYEDSCLYYMHARYYDPTIGRFLSEDPIWSTNLYAYADNNPTMCIDPNGKEPVSDYLSLQGVLHPGEGDAGDFAINLASLIGSFVEIGGLTLVQGGLMAAGLGTVGSYVAVAAPYVFGGLAAFGIGYKLGDWLLNKVEIQEIISNAMDKGIEWAIEGVGKGLDAIRVEDALTWCFVMAHNAKANVKDAYINAKNSIVDSGLDWVVKQVRKIVTHESNKQKKAKNCIKTIK